MKYIITESQAKIAAAFLKLDLKNFIQIDQNNRIYFFNSKNDKYAQICYNKKTNDCYINYDLIEEIYSFFSLQRSDSEQVIGKWVEKTLNMPVNYSKETFFLRILTP